ncbi:unnamed protein product [Enterobius vermicularis]|uniref:Uncharacterized protein n=1 Tax=Enterobius vermicularis TaxID=51028 RepID=A0A0N4UUM0_ENTVE|nr:unnamed protein product [Enterobius vermicularis]
MDDGEDISIYEKWKPGSSVQLRHTPKAKSNQEGNEKGHKYSRYFKQRKNELSRHLHLIRSRAIDRCLHHQKEGAKVKYGFPSMTSRLTKRVGFSAFAKHSKMVFNPKRLPSPLQESVKEGIKALIAKDPTDDTDQWTKAPMLEKRRMGYNSEREDFLCQQPILAQDRHPEKSQACECCPKVDSTSSRVCASFFSPGILTQSQKKDSKVQAKDDQALFFPPDPPLHEIAERVLSSLPFLTLRNGDSATYSNAACSLAANALKSRGIELSHSGSALVNANERSNSEEYDSYKDILTSFYNRTDPFGVTTPNFASLFEQLGSLDENGATVFNKIDSGDNQNETSDISPGLVAQSQMKPFFDSSLDTIMSQNKSIRDEFENLKDVQLEPVLEEQVSDEGASEILRLVNSGQSIFGKSVTDFTSNKSSSTESDVLEALSELHGFDCSSENSLEKRDSANQDASEVSASSPFFNEQVPLRNSNVPNFFTSSPTVLDSFRLAFV